ncbi:MAG: competence protein ComE [Cyanothece sp. SIO1E1]|nr:competence protein ComE [Cyanothece sp. SIO1E1]
MVGMLLLNSCNQPQSSSALAPILEPLPQDPLIQVYFNHSQANAYTEPYRPIERLGNNLEQVIVEAIAAAELSIEIAVQELNLPQIAQALQERHQAGVRVRVILENHYSRPWSDLTAGKIEKLRERDRTKYAEFLQLVDQNQDEQLSPTEINAADALQILHQAQIPWIDDTADGSKGSGLMHHKFVVVDGTTVITGSSNMTTSGIHGDFLNLGSRGNANHLVKIASPALAKLFIEEFNLMWGDGPGGQPDSRFGLQKPYRPAQEVILSGGSSIKVQFSPTTSARPWSESVNGLINDALAQATQTIDLALFVFSDQNLSRQLESRHQQQVEIRALIDAGFAYRNYSEGLDLMGLAIPDQRCRYEQNNHPWQHPIMTVGSPHLPEGDVLHHKFGLIDQKTVILGSQNWSQAANEKNDENLLVIHNPTVAAHFEREFERLYTTATLGITARVQAKIQAQQEQCR